MELLKALNGVAEIMRRICDVLRFRVVCSHSSLEVLLQREAIDRIVAPMSDLVRSFDFGPDRQVPVSHEPGAN
jgi:hypothetical protein